MTVVYLVELVLVPVQLALSLKEMENSKSMQITASAAVLAQVHVLQA